MRGFVVEIDFAFHALKFFTNINTDYFLHFSNKFELFRIKLMKTEDRIVLFFNYFCYYPYILINNLRNQL